MPLVCSGSLGFLAGLSGRDASVVFQLRPIIDSDVSYLDSASEKLTILGYDDRNFGYLRVAVDDRQLHIDFVCISRASHATSSKHGTTGSATQGPAAPQVTFTVVLDLEARKLVQPGG